jgi:Ser/Thr protein kinase RdoA (MazF antagonist)
MLRRPLAIVGAQFDRKEDRDDLTRIGGRLMTALSSAPLTFGFAHGDLNSSNILFRDGGETVIDFDCCGLGYRAYDIAAFARGVTLTRMPGPEASALISAQLAGYVEVSPILPRMRPPFPPSCSYSGYGWRRFITNGSTASASPALVPTIRRALSRG